MNQQQATDFVLRELVRGRAQADIAAELAQQLRAPRDLVEKFVARVEAQNPQARLQPPPQPAPEVQLPPWLREAETAGQPQAGPFLPEDAPLPVTPGSGQSSQRITDIKEAEALVLARLGLQSPRQEIVAELARRTGEPVELAERFVTLVEARRQPARTSVPPPAPEPPRLPTARAAGKALSDDPELVRLVFSELSKHRQRSDVVMMVCERTGVEWSQAQRFVAQVETEQRGKISARKNILVIPLGIIFIISGLAVAISNAQVVIFLLGPAFNPTSVSPEIIEATISAMPYAPYLFLAGLGMIAGGVVGIVLAIRSQTD